MVFASEQPTIADGAKPWLFFQPGLYVRDMHRLFLVRASMLSLSLYVLADVPNTKRAAPAFLALSITEIRVP
jgi:hypothetical protein